MAINTTAQAGGALDDLAAALRSGDQAKVQEAIREFNLNYANSVATLYGQNWGPGNPAPIGAYTTNMQQQYGGYYAPNSLQYGTQTEGAQAQVGSLAGSAAGLTGYYNNPQTWEFQPGTYVRNRQTGQVGQISDNGQLHTLTTVPPALDLNTVVTIDTPQFQSMQQAGQSTTAQTQQATAQQANLAAQQAGVTGVYNQPLGNIANDAFSRAGAGSQRAYLNQYGGDTATAAQHYWQDVQGAIAQSGQTPEQFVYGTSGPQASLALQQVYGTYGMPATGQQTLAAQNQYFNQAQNLAQQFGGYYAPGAPGQAGVAGINTPQQGQLTLANIAQQNAIKQAWAQQYGYVPEFDANGQPIFQAGANGNPAATLAAQQQTYAQQMGLINQAASLQANPFRQQQAIGQMSRLLGNQGVASFSAPNTVAGVGTAGGNTQGGMGYLSQMIDDIRSPGANQASMQGVLDAIPTPNKVNSTEFMRSAPSTQNMVLQGMQEKYGLDPADAMQQIKNTLPQFAAPNTYGTVRRG